MTGEKIQKEVKEEIAKELEASFRSELKGLETRILEAKANVVKLEEDRGSLIKRYNDGNYVKSNNILTIDGLYIPFLPFNGITI